MITHSVVNLFDEQILINVFIFSHIRYLTLKISYRSFTVLHMLYDKMCCIFLIYSIHGGFFI